jgi:hypothetical protein
MAGEPIKPKSAGEVASKPTDQHKAGPLPEARTSTPDDIAAFVAKARAISPHRTGASGRLVFALDATMNRQPTWDMACALQADTFREAASIGSLDIRLVYYRGFNECRATGWISDSARLATAIKDASLFRLVRENRTTKSIGLDRHVYDRLAALERGGQCSTAAIGLPVHSAMTSIFGCSTSARQSSIKNVVRFFSASSIELARYLSCGQPTRFRFPIARVGERSAIPTKCTPGVRSA